MFVLSFFEFLETMKDILLYISIMKSVFLFL
nr:MAG TPA: hypothetical protein [Caudoviricetes sp.]